MLVTSIQRRGDIFFCKDNIKGVNAGHFYLVYATSDGYRKPNMAFQLTSSELQEKSLVKLIMNQGGGKAPTIVKVNPYGIYEIPDKEFIASNYRGYINPDDESFKLIEALFLGRFNPIKLWDGTNSTQFWLDDWNSRVDREYQKRTSVCLPIKSSQSIGLKTVETARPENHRQNTSAKVKPTSRVDIRIQDMEFFKDVNHEIFNIPNVLKQGSKAYRMAFDRYQDLFEILRLYDRKCEKYKSIYDRIASFKSISKFAEEDGIPFSTAWNREQAAIKQLLKCIPLPIFPINQENNIYTKKQIDSMGRRDLAFLQWYLIKEMHGDEITEEVRRETNYIKTLLSIK